MRFIVRNEEISKIECYLLDECVGYINYYFTRNGVWLNKIVVNKEYRNKGIGTALVKIFENESLNMRKRIVEGKYFPEGEEDSVVRGFYKKHGYSISKEGYETEIFKNLQIKHDLKDLNIEYFETAKNVGRH